MVCIHVCDSEKARARTWALWKQQLLITWIFESEKKKWFVMFVDFSGVNTTTMADLKLPMI